MIIGIVLSILIAISFSRLVGSKNMVGRTHWFKILAPFGVWEEVRTFAQHHIETVTSE